MARHSRSPDGQPAQHRVTLNLTAAEYERLVQLAGTLSLSEYLRRTGLQHARPNPTQSLHREIYLELGRIGQSLNQIARACSRTAQKGSRVIVQESWFVELQSKLRQTQWAILNPITRTDDSDEEL
jgi:hypothetical protein